MDGVGLWLYWQNRNNWFLIIPIHALDQACQEGTVTKNFYVSATAPSYIQASGISGMMTYLAKGPISVAVDASTWSAYSSGVLRCGRNLQYNHAVVLVGVESTGNYIVRNSWGPNWGESGYIRISSSSTANCGILSYMFFPKLLWSNIIYFFRLIKYIQTVMILCSCMYGSILII